MNKEELRIYTNEDFEEIKEKIIKYVCNALNLVHLRDSIKVSGDFNQPVVYAQDYDLDDSQLNHLNWRISNLHWTCCEPIRKVYNDYVYDEERNPHAIPVSITFGIGDYVANEYIVVSPMLREGFNTFNPQYFLDQFEKEIEPYWGDYDIYDYIHNFILSDEAKQEIEWLRKLGAEDIPEDWDKQLIEELKEDYEFYDEEKVFDYSKIY